jgi:integrase
LRALAEDIGVKRSTTANRVVTVVSASEPMTTRQYARLADEWVAAIGLSRAVYGAHSLRRTKATLIYRKTGNIRAVQLLLGHTKNSDAGRVLISSDHNLLAFRDASH